MKFDLRIDMPQLVVCNFVKHLHPQPSGYRKNQDFEIQNTRNCGTTSGLNIGIAMLDCIATATPFAYPNATSYSSLSVCFQSTQGDPFQQLLCLFLSGDPWLVMVT